MTTSITTLNIQTIAAQLLTSLEDTTLSLSTKIVADQTENPGLKKCCRNKTIGRFLLDICNMKGRINKPFIEAMEVILYFLDNREKIMMKIEEERRNEFRIKKENFLEENKTQEKTEEIKAIAVLGIGEQPLFERILSAIKGAIFFMKNSGYDATERQGAMVEDYCFSTLSKTETANKFGYTVENIRILVENFKKNLLSGKTFSRVRNLYIIDPEFSNEISKLRKMLPGILLNEIKEKMGNMSTQNLSCVLDIFDCEVLNIQGTNFIIEKGFKLEYRKIMDNTRRMLAKSVTALPLTDLTKEVPSKMKGFLERFLQASSDIQITGDGEVIMIGEGLQEAVRQARIIYEAKDWISKEEISVRYEAIYGEPMGAFNSDYIKKLGCRNQGKLSLWGYGSPEKDRLIDVIQTVLTPLTPVRTFQTILNAVRAKGLTYPEATIRAYITNIATPETKNHDLFCLKNFTHLYTNLSWRKFKKQPQ